MILLWSLVEKSSLLCLNRSEGGRGDQKRKYYITGPEIPPRGVAEASAVCLNAPRLKLKAGAFSREACKASSTTWTFLSYTGLAFRGLAVADNDLTNSQSLAYENNTQNCPNACFLRRDPTSNYEGSSSPHRQRSHTRYRDAPLCADHPGSWWGSSKGPRFPATIPTASLSVSIGLLWRSSKLWWRRGLLCRTLAFRPSGWCAL